MAPLSQHERAVAHLRSAIRYERRGLAKKAAAHFGRAMHYGAFEDLPDEVLELIIESALKGESYELLSRMALIDTRLRRLVPKANFFRSALVSDIRKHPLFARAWRKIANMPLDAWLTGPTPNHDGESAELQIAIKQLLERSMGEWYHFRPDLFHPMVKILHDSTLSDTKRQLASDKLQSFMAHLDSGPCAECAILQKDGPEGPKEQIRRIVNNEFRPTEIGQSEGIHVVVNKYFTDSKDDDLKKYGHVCVWNTGSVENMSQVFQNNRWKNGEWDVRLWDTGSVTRMHGAFQHCATTGPFSGVEFWNTRNVKDMSSMFYGAIQFNQNIGKWDTGNVEDMSTMFYMAKSLNQDIGNWDTEKVKNMSMMFSHAALLNRDIGKWKTGNVTNMSGMFDAAVSFNRDIGKWDTGNVENMSSMFREAAAFNQNIGNWITKNVRDMSSMFDYAASFSQDISRWDMKNVPKKLRPRDEERTEEA